VTSSLRRGWDAHLEIEMDLGPPIVAVASPPGVGLRGVVRMSGAGTHATLRALADDPLAIGSDRRPMRVTLRLGAGGLPALATLQSAPNTFTGEESAELFLPGNPLLLAHVVDALLDAAERRGTSARMARPGEFTSRAYLNGRLSLDRAESIAIASSARRDDELHAARLLAEGRLGAAAESWSERTIELLALVEAGIDFTDEEDVVPIDARTLRERCESIANEIDAATAGALRPERLAGTPMVVLVGRTNAGKSALFNALLESDRTVSTPMAGTTRDAISATTRVGSSAGEVEIMLVDIAGEEDPARAGDDPLHELAQLAARRAVSRADCLVRCVPLDEPPTPTRGPARDRARRDERWTRVPELLVRTKSDLVEAARSEGSSDTVDADDAASPIVVSALHGLGLDRLRSAIADAVTGEVDTLADATLAVTARQDRTLREATFALRDAARVAGAGDRGEDGRGALDAPELVAAALRTALDRLGEITGRVVADDILGAIFGRFCIGK